MVIVAVARPETDYKSKKITLHPFEIKCFETKCFKYQEF